MALGGASKSEPGGIMNSRVSWSVDGIDPSVRERAEAAARRAGLSLNDWLSSTVGDAVPPNVRNRPEQRSSHVGRDVADIHQRLDSITSQIEQISQPARRNDREQGVARQLNDAISRLDARLAQISNPQPPKQDRQRDRDAVERAAAQVYRHSPPLSPASFDSAIAEIAARQNELDVPAQRPLPASSSPPIAPQGPQGPDFSSLERHLLKITSQIEALQRPSGVENRSLRSAASSPRSATPFWRRCRAAPSRSIESEIRQLSRRIDDNRQSGADTQALAGIERALAEIRDVVRSLTPAEQLAGYDEAIRNLTAKLDMLLRANDDPSTVQKLEGAITALRAIVSNVASNDALARLSDDLRLLSSKVDQLARSGDSSDSFAMLERRIAALTSALESRERPQADDRAEQIESALRALSDRIDHLQVGNDNASAFAHLEQRVSYLLERLEASGDHRSDNLTRVEGALQDILGHLERQHAAFARLSDNARSAPEPQDSDFIDTVRRELSDIRFSQNETNRHTQDSLEAVHSTLGHVVDRLTMIEGDLRAARADTPHAAIAPPLAPMPEEPQAAPPRASLPPQPRPELPNPAAAQAAFVAAPRDFHAAPEGPPTAPPPPLAISEILVPHAAAQAPRITIAPDLPPDHPLEPGTRPGARGASPSERIAASENAISEIPAAPRPPVSSSSFIAAARRAAQAAAAAQAAPEKGRAAKSGKTATKEPSSLTSKIRSVLVAASVVVIVLGTFKMAMSMLDGRSMPLLGISGPPKAPANHPAASGARPAAPDPVMPSLTSPTPIGRQSFNAQPPDAPDATTSAAIAQSPAASPITASDITGAIPAAPATTSASTPALIPIPANETLPEAIGGPVLRTAALKGEPAAAYEIAVRYAKGRGVPENLPEAAKWYDRAARGGIVPAIFRTRDVL